MKVAVSSMGSGLNSQVSPVFGRCPYFVIVDIEGKEIRSEKSIENAAMMQSGGAGIMAAQLVANENVGAVISVAIGPRAFAVLQQLGIKIFTAVPGTVEENVKMMIENKLKEVSAPAPMGFGMGRGFGRGGFGFGRGRGWQ
ncbi:MAG TPA: hypothetical protein ENG42_01385 [Candidatus Aenigmarchaeota archaeon]|nr:MAG: hypothetical protein DRP03_01655 [Candidatus Aenigmarchaeota archaeon]HDD46103.1 hypothetical protein [Candidatus Aenigmarchaeota archaeon]